MAHCETLCTSDGIGQYSQNGRGSKFALQISFDAAGRAALICLYWPIPVPEKSCFANACILLFGKEKGHE